ncbi:MAG: hypothetical protein C0183_02815 [Roseiflexus castenholzii]|nr:MAG: hypothetical protein C0183_02815 [Roseiflexus castenholzii]
MCNAVVIRQTIAFLADTARARLAMREAARVAGLHRARKRPSFIQPDGCVVGRSRVDPLATQ